MRRLRNHSGDTIVEVLMATVVLGMILASSYAIASRSLRAARQAQEHGEALKLAESQVELLKNYQASLQPAGETIFSTGKVFCMVSDYSAQNYTQRVNFGDEVSTLPDVLNDDFSKYPADCKKVDSRYHIGVQATTVSSAHQFKVTVRWDSFGNSIRDEVMLQYRLSP